MVMVSHLSDVNLGENYKNCKCYYEQSQKEKRKKIVTVIVLLHHIIFC